MIIKLEESPEFLDAVRTAIRLELSAIKNEIKKEQESTIMTLKEVAEFLQVSTQTIKQYMRLGIPHFQEGQVIRFLKSDVIEWIKNHNQNGKEQ